MTIKTEDKPNHDDALYNQNTRIPSSSPSSQLKNPVRLYMSISFILSFVIITFYTNHHRLISVQQQRQQYQNNLFKKKPYCILHVGPGKTATSSIQEFLHHERENGTLASDSYAYIQRRDKHIFQEFLHCVNGGDDDSHPDDCRNNPLLWQSVRDHLSFYSHNGTNLILSDESYEKVDYNRRDWRAFERALMEDFDVRVVVAYRRFYDWLISWHSFSFGMLGPHYREMRAWFKEREGVHVRGMTIPSFRDFFLVDYKERTHSNLGVLHSFPQGMEMVPNVTHATFQIKSHLERRFPVVHILDFYDDDNNDTNETILTKFMSFVPHATHTQRAARLWTRGPSNTNQPLLYNMLVGEAQRQGIIDPYQRQKKLARRVAADQLAFRIKRRGWDTDGHFDKLPRICLSTEEEEMLRNVSVYFEAMVFGDDFDEGRRRAHDEGFEAARNKGKFCTVDAERAVREREWKKLLKQL